MYNLLNFIDYINIMLIHIQPLQGWHVGGIFPTGCTCGYSYSTPSGLARRGHISHRLHLWLFIFNPFGVGVSGAHFPQVAPVAIPPSGLARRGLPPRMMGMNPVKLQVLAPV